MQKELLFRFCGSAEGGLASEIHEQTPDQLPLAKKSFYCVSPKECLFRWSGYMTLYIQKIVHDIASTYRYMHIMSTYTCTCACTYHVCRKCGVDFSKPCGFNQGIAADYAGFVNNGSMLQLTCCDFGVVAVCKYGALVEMFCLSTVHLQRQTNNRFQATV